MNQWVAIISLVACLVLALASFRAHQLSIGKTMVMALAWASLWEMARMLGKGPVRRASTRLLRVQSLWAGGRKGTSRWPQAGWSALSWVLWGMGSPSVWQRPEQGRVTWQACRLPMPGLL